MGSVFIGQTVQVGDAGSIAIPVGAATGDLIICFGIARQSPQADMFTFGPGVWEDFNTNATDPGDGNPAFTFAVRKLYAGETDLVFTDMGAPVALLEAVLQVWRGAAQLFTGPAGDYANAIGYPTTGVPTGTGTVPGPTPTLSTALGGVLAFSVMYSIDPTTIDGPGPSSEGYLNYYSGDHLRIDVRGVSDPPPSWPSVPYTFSPDTINYVGLAIGFSGAPEPAGLADWVMPPLEWSAEGVVTPVINNGGVRTVRFDDGEGQPWYIVAPVSDSGHELRSKTIKSMRATGRLTSPIGKIYGYDVSDEIDTSDLENGTNPSVSRALPTSTGAAQSPKKNVNVKNAVLHTIRLEGDDTGNAERDEIHEIIYEQAVQGVRR